MNLPRKNWLEWSVFAAGLLLVVCTLAYLAYDAITTGDAPPSMQVRLGTAEQRAGHFIIPVEVTNLGDQTAEGFNTQGALAAFEGRARAQGAYYQAGSSLLQGVGNAAQAYGTYKYRTAQTGTG